MPEESSDWLERMRPDCFLAHSRTLAGLTGLPALLGAPLVHRSAASADRQTQAVVVGWGLKPSAVRSARFAARQGLPFWRLEDGFVRSVALGRDEPPLSVVVDDLGIYYDANSPSRLELLIGAAHSAAERSRAAALVELWQASRISKYNYQRDHSGALPEPFVLAVDQTRGDASIGHGRADAASFQRMLLAALEEHPDCTVVVKVHPEVIAGRKQGHFDLQHLSRHPRVLVLTDEVHPASLLERTRAVYTVTSQLGFEGVLWGRAVRTFGMPFYAGWGLTRDELPAPRHRRPVSREDLAFAALIQYPRYLDPESGSRCEAEQLITWLALQRQMRERFPATVYACGFSRWKKPIVRDYFQGSRVNFVRRGAAVPSGGVLITWGHQPVKGSLSTDVARFRLEDGFLRSVGLGADLVRPLSWVVDRRGIYYDATVPSDLEILLQETVFDERQRLRAGALREKICRIGLTKYNVGADLWHRPAGAGRVILVPGQVEGDASLRYGAPDIRTNLRLLKAVRTEHPDAYLVYKPHPDVAAGLRGRGAGEEDAADHCDEIVTGASMAALLEKVDEVHTMTSLAGFEALLRGKRVVTYGQPFYMGWGLTEDRAPLARRSRRLSVDELVAGVLLIYSVYVSRKTRRFTTAEQILDELQEWRAEGAGGLPCWRRGWRLINRWRSREP